MPLAEPQLTPNTKLWITDDGSWVTIEILVTSEYQSEDPIMEEMPWAYTLNGVRDPWRTVRIMPGVWTRLGRLFVPKSQTVWIHIADTGTTEIGGPHDFSFYVNRGDTLSVARITQGVSTVRAIPYVNVQGVWKTAESYAKNGGVWKQTT